MRLKEEIKLYSNNTSIMVENQKIMRNGGASVILIWNFIELL